MISVETEYVQPVDGSGFYPCIRDDSNPRTANQSVIGFFAGSVA